MEHGDAVLHTRADGATELRINGVFVMDDHETTSERLLATRALAAVDDPRHVLVGGLGLGYTTRELLADPRVQRVTVAEIEPAVVAWMRSGTVPGVDLLEDPRVVVVVGDVRDVVTAATPASLDAIVLDVDNGPDSLVLPANAAVYHGAFLGVCSDRLRAGGTVVVWSQEDSAALRSTLAEHFTDVSVERVPVRLQDRDEAYWLIRAAAPDRPR